MIALTVMEIVLGINNIVFISIQTAKLPEGAALQSPLVRPRARRWGRGSCCCSCINWIMQLTQAIFFWSDLLTWLTPRLDEATMKSLGLESMDWLLDDHHKDINAFTWKDLVLLVGGLFLLNSIIREIHHKMEGFTTTTTPREARV